MHAPNMSMYELFCTSYQVIGSERIHISTTEFVSRWRYSHHFNRRICNKSFLSRGICLTVRVMTRHGISVSIAPLRVECLMLVISFAYYYQLNVQKVNL